MHIDGAQHAIYTLEKVNVCCESENNDKQKDALSLFISLIKEFCVHMCTELQHLCHKDALEIPHTGEVY